MYYNSRNTNQVLALVGHVDGYGSSIIFQGAQRYMGPMQICELENARIKSLLGHEPLGVR